MLLGQDGLWAQSLVPCSCFWRGLFDRKKSDIPLLALFGRKRNLFVLRLRMVLCSGVRALRMSVSKAILEKVTTKTLRVLGSSRKETEIILKREKMEGSVSQGRQAPTLRRWLLQRQKGGVDIYRTQVNRAIQSVPGHHSKECATLHQTKVLKPILKPGSWGTPERAKEVTFTFHTRKVYPGGPGSPENLHKALSPWQLYHPEAQASPLLPHTPRLVLRCAERCTPGGSCWRSQLSIHRLWSCAQIHGLLCNWLFIKIKTKQNE